MSESNNDLKQGINDSEAFFIETSDEEIEAEQTEKELEAYLEKEETVSASMSQPPQTSASIPQPPTSMPISSPLQTENVRTSSEKRKKNAGDGKILTVKGRFRAEKKRIPGSEHIKAWGTIAALILVAFLVLNSSLFELKHWEIIGNHRVTDESIMTDLGLKEGTNLFRYAVSHMKASPHVDPRLSTVDVYFQWPSSVRIVVEESSTIGYVYFQGVYLCIDRKGQVANTTADPDDDLPVIEGLKVGSFNIGECLNTEDVERYDAVVAIGTALKKYNLETKINVVNVRVLTDIVLYADKMEIRIGTIKDVERKVCVVADVLEMDGLPEGTMHIESMDSQIYIEPKAVESEFLY